MDAILIEKDEREKISAEDIDPEEIALMLQGRIDDCCIS